MRSNLARFVWRFASSPRKISGVYNSCAFVSDSSLSRSQFLRTITGYGASGDARDARPPRQAGVEPAGAAPGWHAPNALAQHNASQLRQASSSAETSVQSSAREAGRVSQQKARKERVELLLAQELKAVYSAPPDNRVPIDVLLKTKFPLLNYVSPRMLAFTFKELAKMDQPEAAFDLLQLAVREVHDDSRWGPILAVHFDMVFSMCESRTNPSLHWRLCELQAALLEQMNQVDMPVKLSHWNSYMMTLSRNGQYRDTLEIFEDLRKHPSLTPNGLTFGWAISASVQLGDLTLAHKLLEDMRLAKQCTPMGYNTLIKYHGADKEAHNPADQELAAHPVFELLDMMEADGVAKDWYTFLHAFHGLVGATTEKLEARGPKLFDEMVSLGIMPAASTVSTIIDIFGRLPAPDASRALQVARQLQDMGITFDPNNWNALLKACARRGDGRAAMQIFQDMTASGVAPQSWSFHYILDALSHSPDNAMTAVKVFRQFKDHFKRGTWRRMIGYSPDQERRAQQAAIRSMILICADLPMECMAEVRRFAAQQSGGEMHLSLIGPMISTIMKKGMPGQAMMLLRGIKDPDQSMGKHHQMHAVFNAALEGLCLNKCFQEAVHLHAEIERLGFPLNTESTMRFTEMLAEMGDWESVERRMQSMPTSRNFIYRALPQTFLRLAHTCSSHEDWVRLLRLWRAYAQPLLTDAKKSPLGTPKGQMLNLLLLEMGGRQELAKEFRSTLQSDLSEAAFSMLETSLASFKEELNLHELSS